MYDLLNWLIKKGKSLQFKFEEVTPEEVKALKVKLQDSGMQVSAWPNAESSIFKFNGHHINGTATYDLASQVLSGELSKPFFVSEESITNGLMEFLSTKPTASRDDTLAKDDTN